MFTSWCPTICMFVIGNIGLCLIVGNWVPWLFNKKKLYHASILSGPYKILFLYCFLVFLQADFCQGCLIKILFVQFNLSTFSRNASEAYRRPFFHIFKISLCTLRNLQVEGYWWLCIRLAEATCKFLCL